MELRGSKTEKNLWEAFAGESQARNKYTYFASKAKKEGYEQISAIFTETANNEKEHAKIWFKLLMENGEIPDTLTCLKMAAAGENEEHTSMYPRMAAEAKAEGFTQIAALFTMVAAIEKALAANSGGRGLRPQTEQVAPAGSSIFTMVAAIEKARGAFLIRPERVKAHPHAILSMTPATINLRLPQLPGAFAGIGQLCGWLVHVQRRVLTLPRGFAPPPVSRETLSPLAIAVGRGSLTPPRRPGGRPPYDFHGRCALAHGASKTPPPTAAIFSQIFA